MLCHLAATILLHYPAWLPSSHATPKQKTSSEWENNQYFQHNNTTNHTITYKEHDKQERASKHVSFFAASPDMLHEWNPGEHVHSSSGCSPGFHLSSNPLRHPSSDCSSFIITRKEIIGPWKRKRVSTGNWRCGKVWKVKEEDVANWTSSQHHSYSFHLIYLSSEKEGHIQNNFIWWRWKVRVVTVDREKSKRVKAEWMITEWNAECDVKWRESRFRNTVDSNVDSNDCMLEEVAALPATQRCSFFQMSLG